MSETTRLRLRARAPGEELRPDFTHKNSQALGTPRPVASISPLPAAGAPALAGGLPFRGGPSAQKPSKVVYCIRCVYPRHVVTRDAIFIFEMPSGETRLVLDLFPALSQSYGPLADAFRSNFRLIETNEIPGLRSLRADATLGQFLDFFGSTWQDARDRWPTLAWMCDYRKAHGDGAYASIEPWIRFYELLNDRIVPFRIELGILEHY